MKRGFVGAFVYCIVGVIPWCCVFRLDDVGPSLVVCTGNRIGDEGAKALAAALPHSNVTSINLGGGDNLGVGECFLG